MDEQKELEMEELMKSQPWDPIESKLVKYSLISGVIALIVLGLIINFTILK